MQLDKIEKVYTGKWISLYKLHYNDGKGHNKIYEMVSKSGTERNKCELDLLIVIADGNIVNSKDINEEIYANWYSKSDILSLIDNKKEKFASRNQAFCYMWAIS